MADDQLGAMKRRMDQASPTPAANSDAGIDANAKKYGWSDQYVNDLKYNRDNKGGPKAMPSASPAQNIEQNFNNKMDPAVRSKGNY